MTFRLADAIVGVVHGSGGGHDQGMAFAGTLAQHGIRVIAVSRFGDLRTPMLATPPGLLTAASLHERARVQAMLDNILPVSARAEGLCSDTAVGKHLVPAPLGAVHVPTLIVSARDDRYRTFASAQYTANGNAGAKFIGFDQGGHTWVGHDDQVMSETVELLVPRHSP